MKLTEWFDSEEFGKELNSQGLQNYYLLCLLVLDPIRSRFGVVKITSGFRSLEDHERLKRDGYNPSETSQHLHAEACDFVCPYAETMGLVYRFILDELDWPGEVLLYKRAGHVHLGLPRLGVKSDHLIFEDK